MHINQQDAQILVISLYFSLVLYMFRTFISPSSGATFYKLYIASGICRYHTRGYSHTTAIRIGIYRHIPNAYKMLLLMMD